MDSLSLAKKDDPIPPTTDVTYEKMVLQRGDGHEYVSSVTNPSLAKTANTIPYSLHSTHPPLPAIPVPAVPLTEWDVAHVGVAKEGEKESVYDNIAGDQ